MNDLVERTLAELAAQGDPRRAAFSDGYHPSAARVLGVSAPVQRQIARQLRVETRGWSLDALLALALALTRSGVHEGRQVALELLAAHRGVAAQLDRAQLEALGQGMDNWVSVDTFGCLVAGAALRAGRIGPPDLLAWAGSADRWWRRAALVSTTGWNKKSRGGRGESAGTLAVCQALVGDRDELVVKAMSWALRDLVAWDRGAVAAFIEAQPVAARVRREVQRKLETGRK